jgi:hypothetical protein
MHSICPSLQYIQIYHDVWQVVPHNSLSCSYNACQIQHDFVEIDHDEIAKIELFSFYSFAEQSSLLGSDAPGCWQMDTNRFPTLDQYPTYQGPQWAFGNVDSDSNDSDVEQLVPEDFESDEELQDMIWATDSCTPAMWQG